MGCFCRKAIDALVEQETPETDVQDTVPEDELLGAVNTWLAARLLPAPPWEPNPDWLEVEVPEPPMRPEGLGIVISLVQAYESAKALGLDIAELDQLPKLARIVGTLNRRIPAFEDWLGQDQSPWEQLATLNDQADAVIKAAESDAFLPLPDEEAEEEVDLTLWRPLIRQVKAITPLVAIFQILPDIKDPDAFTQLVRTLRQVVLPPLESPLITLRVIARVSALSRIQASFGVDPRRTPFQRIERAVLRKTETAKLLLPEDVQVQDGVVLNLPARQPNPTQIVNADTIEAIENLTPELIERLQWDPPSFDQFEILVTAAPVMTLARIMATLGPPAIRTSPCGQDCDAGLVSRELTLSVG